MIKVGDRIKVRASKSLGSPAETCVVARVEHAPGEISAYPDGLYLVRPLGLYSEPEDEFHCCSKGFVYSGPPLHGFLVCFP